MTVPVLIAAFMFLQIVFNAILVWKVFQLEDRLKAVEPTAQLHRRLG